MLHPRRNIEIIPCGYSSFRRGQDDVFHAGIEVPNEQRSREVVFNGDSSIGVYPQFVDHYAAELNATLNLHAAILEPALAYCVEIIRDFRSGASWGILARILPRHGRMTPAGALHAMTIPVLANGAWRADGFPVGLASLPIGNDLDLIFAEQQGGQLRLFRLSQRSDIREQPPGFHRWKASRCGAAAIGETQEHLWWQFTNGATAHRAGRGDPEGTVLRTMDTVERDGLKVWILGEDFRESGSGSQWNPRSIFSAPLSRSLACRPSGWL